MENEMIVIKKVNVDELVEQLKIFNSNIAKLNLNEVEDKFFTRDETQEYYNLSKRETDKIYNSILKDFVVDIGKNQRLAKSHIDNMFKNGIKMKFV